MLSRKHIKMTALSLFICLLSSCAAVDYLSGEGDSKAIRQAGRKASAEIIEIWDTGMTLNDDPIVGFKLRVHEAGIESYEVKTKGLVSRLDVPQIQPGRTIPVAIDPNDRTRVAIDIYKEGK